MSHLTLKMFVGIGGGGGGAYRDTLGLLRLCFPSWINLPCTPCLACGTTSLILSLMGVSVICLEKNHVPS